MTRTNRRIFIAQVAACGSAWVATQAMAQAQKLAESDPQATALGYKEDTTKVDAAKYPKHAADQHCGNCQLFQGKPADAQGPCPLFAGKLVASKGWCSAWVKKA